MQMQKSSNSSELPSVNPGGSDDGLVLRQFLLFGLAVLALATVPSQKTGASAQTAHFPNPNRAIS